MARQRGAMREVKARVRELAAGAHQLDSRTRRDEEEFGVAGAAAN